MYRPRWLQPVLWGLVSFAVACDLTNPGVATPDAAIYFPVALALSPQMCGSGPCTLYVANSNFDLRYRTGSMQALDLERVGAAVRDCGEPPCEFPDYGSFIRPHGEVLIGSYAGGIAVSPEGDRVYVPIRSDANLTYIDVSADGGLDCGGRGEKHECASAHERGRQGSSNARGLSMPRDPITVLAGPVGPAPGGGQSGNFIVTGHGDGSVTLFLEQDEGGGIKAPVLIDVDDGYPEGLSALDYDSLTATLYGTTRAEALFVSGGIAVNPTLVERSFVYQSASWRYAGLDDGSDTRDVAVDAQARRAYVISRRPRALLIVDLDAQASSGQVSVSGMVPLGDGPSKVKVGYFNEANKRLIFVSCFDAPAIHVIDADLRRLSAVITGFGGPFDIAVDQARGFIYVADFSSSVIRVVDISQLTEGLGATVVATLGEPRSVKVVQ
ncbi:MAG: hypothetical protein H6714_07185 [Myxococcales bacterium]|nr:hypothetical protein [Myxococcales bacterium]